MPFFLFIFKKMTLSLPKALQDDRQELRHLFSEIKGELFDTFMNTDSFTESCECMNISKNIQVIEKEIETDFNELEDIIFRLKQTLDRTLVIKKYFQIS